MEHRTIVVVSVLLALAGMTTLVYHAFHSPNPWAVVLVVVYLGAMIPLILITRKARQKYERNHHVQ